MKYLLAALLALISLLPAQAQKKAPAADPELDSLLYCLTGDFSSRKQAEADTSFFPITLHMRRIWLDKKDAYYVYVEQAMATRQDKPYRQRVYRLNRQDKKLVSQVFTLPKPLRFAGTWQDPAKLQGITMDSLSSRGGCDIILEKKASGFAGSTQGNNCPSDLRGASYATSEVTLSRHRMLSWDRGFDKDGQQVWGAEKGGYIFERE